MDLYCPTPLGTTVTMTVTMTGRATRMHLPEVVMGSACGMARCLFAASQMLAWEAGHASRASGQDSARCSGRPAPPRVRKQFHLHGDLSGRVPIPTLASNLLLQSSTCIIGNPHLGVAELTRGIFSPGYATHSRFPWHREPSRPVAHASPLVQWVFSPIALYCNGAWPAETSFENAA